MIIYDDYGSYTSTAGEHITSLINFIKGEMDSLKGEEFCENIENFEDVIITIKKLKEMPEDDIITLEFTDWAGINIIERV